MRDKKKHAAYMREWRAKHVEQCRESVRQWRAKHKEKDKANKKKYRQGHRAEEAGYKKRWSRENKTKVNIYHVILRATKSGRLIKPIECSSCGSEGRIEGHHNDYSKPLTVIWLCPDCHKNLHAGESK